MLMLSDFSEDVDTTVLFYLQRESRDQPAACCPSVYWQQSYDLCRTIVWSAFGFKTILPNCRVCFTLRGDEKKNYSHGEQTLTPRVTMRARILRKTWCHVSSPWQPAWEKIFIMIIKKKHFKQRLVQFDFRCAKYFNT